VPRGALHRPRPSAHGGERRSGSRYGLLKCGRKIIQRNLYNKLRRE
jgi:hypothetical protein